MSGSLNVILPAPISQYTRLVTSQYQNQPNFMATIAASVQPFSDITAVILSFQADYDLDIAVGSQEDAVGLWIGATRYLSEAVDGYFSWDDAGLGWDQGVWFVDGESEVGIVVLDDDSYRFLLKARIVSNHWNGTVEQAYEFWNMLFNIVNDVVTIPLGEFITAPAFGTTLDITVSNVGDTTGIAIQDIASMQMAFCLTGAQPSTLTSMLFAAGAFNLNPAGVLVWLCQPSIYPGGVAGGTPLFGLDAENQTIGGLDSGAWVSIVSNS